MSPFGRALFELWPYLAAFVIGFFVPRRQNLLERAGVGVVAALATALVIGLWPAKQAGEAAAPEEWPLLLNVIVFFTGSTRTTSALM